MADPDIPVAFNVTPLAPPAMPPPTAPTTTSNTVNTSDLRTAMNRAGSSRLQLPTNGQEHEALTAQTLRALEEQGFTQGLAHAMKRNKLAFPLSIWIVDNSGSMANRDGHRVVETSKQSQVKFVPCTRWAEMQQTVDYHAQMAALLKSPTVFRLLNDPGRAAGPQQFSIAERGTDMSTIDEDLAIAQSTMGNAAPGGVTPLIPHLQEVRNNILALEPSLRSSGTKVVLVLASDGLPSDNRGMSDATVKRQFVETLRSLEGLPVWVVVRLCTDEEEVVDFWNSLDNQLEISLEVLDDFQAEAAEAHEHNPWLNYGLPLHRMREMGFHNRLFDLLDERSLAKDELRDFFRLLLGDGALDGVPDPQVDWSGFCKKIGKAVDREKKTYNPTTKRMEPWVNMSQLKRAYGGGWFFW